MATDLLKDIQIKNAKPKTKPYKLFDGDGLFLLIHPNGSKYWRLKYRWQGKEKLLSIGVYPVISLSEAREKRLEAKKLLANNHNPSEIKKEQKRLSMLNSENSFEVIAREWHDVKSSTWSAGTKDYILRRLENDVFPRLGHRPIKNITAPELFAVMKEIEKRGAYEMVNRALQVCGQVFKFAIATGRAENNPAPNLTTGLKKVVKKHYARLSEEELPEFLNKLEGYKGNLLTKLGIKIIILTFVRTIELRGAEWTEINFEKAEWRIPAERMKMRKPHIVPLSVQALELFNQLKAISGYGKYVLPNEVNPKKFISENTMTYGLYRLGYHSRATMHGFRATASTILNEKGFNGDVIERQLAHSESNKSRAAYDHSEHMEKRKQMMQWWADYIDSLTKKQ